MTTRREEPGGLLSRRVTRDLDTRRSVAVDVDLDDARHVVSGVLVDRRLDGTQLRGEPRALHLIERQTGTRAEVPISSDAEAPFTARLPRGTYDAMVIEQDADGRSRVDLLTPATLVVEGDGETALVLSVLPRVALHGVVTVNGGPMRANRRSASSRGAITFSCLEGCPEVSARVEIAAEGEAEYSVALPPGRYRVGLEPAQPVDWDLPSPQDALPPANYQLRPELEVRADARRDFDVPVFVVEGEVRSNAGDLPERDALGLEAGAARSSLRLERLWTGWHLTDHASVEVSGPARYRFEAYPGRYQLSLAQVGRALYPSGGALRAFDVAGAPITRNFDVELVAVRGALSVNGGPWPSEESANAEVVFSGEDGRATVGPDAEGRFALQVPARLGNVAFWRVRGRGPLPEGAQPLRGACPAP